MSGNSFGKLFTLTSFGESHGPAIGCVIDGCPPGLELSEDDFVNDLKRRATGMTPFTAQRREQDKITILSGVFEGKTTGTPIALTIDNHDARSKDYDNIKDKFRPGHADYTYYKKYGIRDYRGGGRASARETAMRVAAGVVAKKYLYKQCGLQIRACLFQVGDIIAKNVNWSDVVGNSFSFPYSAQVVEIENFITQLRKEGNSIGAKILVEATNVPLGLGEPVFAKLDADIASALMGINAVKAVEIGSGCESALQKGSEHRDEMTADGFLSNNAGGILGGISTGQPIVATVTFKPTSSIVTPGKSININNDSVSIVTKGRHDPCVGIRAVPIVEAMLALVLMDHYLRDRAQCGERK